MAPPFDAAPEVAAAIAGGRPVVALESTIITHGMSAPQNLEIAREVEALVRAEGAVPATIAVLQGRLTIGLNDAQLEQLASAENVRKLSSADLAHAMLCGDHGSTTVAATMTAMEASGLTVFATGGIGGVHRGAENDFDISADLDALSRLSLVVVCAGPKAILDVPSTMEALETRGVPVLGFGTDILPTFWSRDGSIAAPLRLDAPGEVADLYGLRTALGQRGSILVTNPVPEADAIPSVKIEGAIETALADAREGRVRGKDVTPYLLDRMFDLTDGRSLEANAALIRNNARLAARIAVAMRR